MVFSLKLLTNLLNINQNKLNFTLISRLINRGESDSEKWLKYVSKEGYKNGNISAFEDEYGDIIKPTGSLSNTIPIKKLKTRSIYNRNNFFIDSITTTFKGGNGGDGMISFLRLFCNPFGGPSGGDGGNGSHIILRANPKIKSLNNIKKVYIGKNGKKGMSDSMTGKSSEHIYVDVPSGTLIKLLPNDNDQDFKLLAELKENYFFIAAKGGMGGKGNQFFLSNNNRHPRIAEKGAIGESNTYLLEMKTIAHVGLVGFPNAGKSTLLKAVSRAKPKIASYPFTTLKPSVGIILYDDYTQIAIADLPGLIKNSHLNKGLGISFLKHLERCVCHVYVIDLSIENVLEQFNVLRKELEFYKKGLSKKPFAIIGNKIDKIESKKNLEILNNYIRENTPKNELPLPVISVSAKNGTNLIEFLSHIRGLYDMFNKPEIDELGFEWNT